MAKQFVILNRVINDGKIPTEWTNCIHYTLRIKYGSIIEYMVELSIISQSNDIYKSRLVFCTNSQFY